MKLSVYRIYRVTYSYKGDVTTHQTAATSREDAIHRIKMGYQEMDIFVKIISVKLANPPK